MRLLPFERLTVPVDSPPEAVELRLAVVVGPLWSLRKRPPRPFRGSIRRRRFKVVRVLGTVHGRQKRNAWKPVVLGELVAVPGGKTEVRAHLRPSVLAGVCTALWFGVLFWFGWKLSVVSAAKGFGTGAAASSGKDAASAAVGLAFVGALTLLTYVYMSFCFWTEVRRTRIALREGLGCPEPAGGFLDPRHLGRLMARALNPSGSKTKHIAGASQ